MAKLDTGTLAEVAAGLRRLLAAIEAGELSASAGEVARLEGAADAIEALAGRDSPQRHT